MTLHSTLPPQQDAPPNLLMVLNDDNIQAHTVIYIKYAFRVLANINGTEITEQLLDGLLHILLLYINTTVNASTEFTRKFKVIYQPILVAVLTIQIEGDYPIETWINRINQAIEQGENLPGDNTNDYREIPDKLQTAIQALQKETNNPKIIPWYTATSDREPARLKPLTPS